jgi:hypothetical protein
MAKVPIIVDPEQRIARLNGARIGKNHGSEQSKVLYVARI